MRRCVWKDVTLLPNLGVFETHFRTHPSSAFLSFIKHHSPSDDFPQLIFAVQKLITTAH